MQIIKEIFKVQQAEGTKLLFVLDSGHIIFHKLFSNKYPNKCGAPCQDKYNVHRHFLFDIWHSFWLYWIIKYIISFSRHYSYIILEKIYFNAQL